MLMKALSIKQPWAWLIIKGYKPIENRTWDTKYRGKVAIHASKTFDKDGYEYVKVMHPNIQMQEPKMYQYGGIIGFADITDCVTNHTSEWFEKGMHGFVMKNPVSTLLIPCKGALGFFDVDVPDRII